MGPVFMTGPFFNLSPVSARFWSETRTIDSKLMDCAMNESGFNLAVEAGRDPPITRREGMGLGGDQNHRR